MTANAPEGQAVWLQEGTLSVVEVGVSVVIPVLDEAKSIARLTRALAEQTLQSQEILVVDGGSTDGTQAKVGSLRNGYPSVRLITAAPASPGRGRNVGAEQARSRWIAFIDAGVVPCERWLERLVRFADSNEQVDAVYGVFDPTHRTFFERCADLAYVPPLATSLRGPLRAGSVASLLLRREAWESAGKFPDLRAAEDLIFMRNLAATARHIEYSPEARVTWEIQPGVWSTFRRFRSYSMHNVLAGQQQYWHHGVARQWLAGAAALAIAALFKRPLIAWLVPAGLLARTLRTLVRRREGRGWCWVARPVQFAGVSALIVLIDVATFTGWVDALLRRRRAAS